MFLRSKNAPLIVSTRTVYTYMHMKTCTNAWGMLQTVDLMMDHLKQGKAHQKFMKTAAGIA
jgi:hypothetical protein